MAVVLLSVALTACSTSKEASSWEVANPIRPLPEPPLGIEFKLSTLPNPPTPERVRLGRWLFYDTRLSGDGSVSCATCHLPERAFSNGTRVARGAGGHAGVRKT